MKKVTGISILVVLLTLVVAADIPKPAPKQGKSINSILRISLQSDAKEARLIIPKSQLLELRAAVYLLSGRRRRAAPESQAATT